MRSLCRITILVALLSMAGLMAAQQNSHSQHGDAAVSAKNNDPAWSELQASMTKMHESMSSIAPSTNSDVDFVRLMLPHHQAALDMAKAELFYGKDPQIRRLAQEIITDQQSEIELMQLWLKQHQTPAPGQNKEQK